MLVIDFFIDDESVSIDIATTVIDYSGKNINKIKILTLNQALKTPKCLGGLVSFGGSKQQMIFSIGKEVLWSEPYTRLDI